MDISVVSGSASVLFSAYGAAKIYYDLSAGRVARMREQYRFAKEYFSDRQSGDADHPFLWEKGLTAIVGDERLDADDVEYLLRLKNPVHAISLYSIGKDYLQLRKIEGSDAIEFRQRYRGRWSRGWRTWTYFGLYGLFVFFAFFPMIFSKHFSTHQDMLSATALTIPVGIFNAWFALKAAIRIKRAETLVKSQQLAKVR